MVVVFNWFYSSFLYINRGVITAADAHTLNCFKSTSDFIFFIFFLSSQLVVGGSDTCSPSEANTPQEQTGDLSMVYGIYFWFLVNTPQSGPGL